MVANLQLGWTPFVDPIDQKYHWGRYAIQWAFTIFVVSQTRSALTDILSIGSALVMIGGARIPLGPPGF
jgi:hypothetical protein